jgi:hypothetical protein
MTDSEAEYVNAPTAVEPGTRQGHDEIVAAMRKQREIMFDGIHEIDRLVDRGDEIIALTRLSRSMPGSDTRIEEPALASYRFHDGKITRIEVLGFGGTDVPKALEAAGLSE